MADARIERATRAARRAAAAYTRSADADFALSLVSDASNFLFRVQVAGDGGGAGTDPEAQLFALRVSGEQSTRTGAQVDCEVALLLELHARAGHSGISQAGVKCSGDMLRHQLHTPIPLLARDGRRVVEVRDSACDIDRGHDSVRRCVAFAWLCGGRAVASENVCMRVGAAVATLHEHCAALADTSAGAGAGADDTRLGVAELQVLDSVFPICPPLAVRVRGDGDGGAGGGSGAETIHVATFDDSSSDATEQTAVAGAKCAGSAASPRGLVVTAGQAELLQRATECSARLLHALYAGELGGRAQVVHGDLHMANVMQDKDSEEADRGIGEKQRLHLIDFDGCAWGFPAQDLAVLLWALQFEGLDEILAGEVSPRYPALRAAVLRGYSAVRPLPEECGRDVGVDIGSCEAALTSESSGEAGAAPWPALPLLDALVAQRDLVVLAWFAATDVPFLRARVPEFADATLLRIREWVPLLRTDG